MDHTFEELVDASQNPKIGSGVNNLEDTGSFPPFCKSLASSRFSLMPFPYHFGEEFVNYLHCMVLDGEWSRVFLAISCISLAKQYIYTFSCL
jgi:hypothetical protein